MAGCSITFKSRNSKALHKDIAKELSNACSLKVEEAISRGMTEATQEIKDAIGYMLERKDFRGFTSVTGNLMEGMGVTVLKYNSKTGKASSRMPTGMMIEYGFGPALRTALDFNETFWLESWGTYEGGNLKLPQVVKYHDGTEIPGVKNKDYEGLYLSRPVWFNKRLYKGETSIGTGLRGYKQRRAYAQELKSHMPTYKNTMYKLVFFSSMPYTQFVDQQKGYRFMEKIRGYLETKGIWDMATHFLIK